MYNKKSSQHIAVLMGGWNAEREVSLQSGEAVYKSLLELGYQASKIDFTPDIANKLNKIKPDIIFNALHGPFGEDGRIQGFLDILQIPYTHSDLLASAISMDKILMSKMVDQINISSPKSAIIKKGEDANNQKIILEEIGKNFVIKPINQGSSIGVQVILEDMGFDISTIDWQYGDEMMVEKYIAGKEIQVAIMDDKALGAIEVRPKNLFYDYECKYKKGMTDYIMPAQITKEQYNQVLDLSLKCHKMINCRGISRVDFILSQEDNQFYFLELNTHPGFTPLSLVPKIAKYCSISFNDIVQYLISCARCGI